VLITGPVGETQYGWTCEGIGDFNGDGYGDFVTGTFDPSLSTAFVIIGDPAKAAVIDLDVAADFRIIGAANAYSRTLNRAGDFNGDGLDDIIIGARSESSSTGAAYLYLGRTSLIPDNIPYTDFNKKYTGENIFDAFSWSLGGAGDYNGDGMDDLIIGANQWNGLLGNLRGKMYIFFGADTPQITIGGAAADIYMEATVNNDELGYSAR